MMHHKHIFYRELARENADFERNYQTSVRLADEKIKTVYKALEGSRIGGERIQYRNSKISNVLGGSLMSGERGRVV